MSQDATKLKEMPTFKSDEGAERFVNEADLSDYDFSKMVPIRFELNRKNK